MDDYTKNPKSNILFFHDGWTAKLLNDDELQIAYKLRYRIFCERLNWLEKNKQKQELDQYDADAIHMGIYSDRNILLGYSRLILPNRQFMLEKEFKSLIEGLILKKGNDSVEITRLAIDNKKLSNKDSKMATMFLYRAMRIWSEKNSIKRWYMVVEMPYFEKLRETFYCEKIGKEVYFKKNYATVAGLIDLETTEKYLSITNPRLHQWYFGE